ncbi:MAG: MATE family efflux transporter [Acutalibacteraceae bacterium]
MDLLTGNLRNLYLRYLSAAFGSAMISSIYGLVDAAMVGQYQGPDGAAALAVFAPIWNIIYSLGLLGGIGGSILFAAARGSRGDGTENRFFTAAVLLCSILSALCWGLILFLPGPLLRLFGADDTLLPLAMDYLRPVSAAVPVFLFNQLLSSFLRNDSRPGLTTAAVLAGGIFNVAGDYFFIFTLDLGIFGAGLATSLGAVIQLAILLSHFLSKSCTLRLVSVHGLPALFGRIAAAGFSSFFIDVAMGLLTMLFNRQIMRLLGSDALAVYGIIVNVSTIVQCCGYSVGQAARPILFPRTSAPASSPDPPAPAAGRGRLPALRHRLDRRRLGSSPGIRPCLHGPVPGGARHRSRNPPDLCPLLPAPAVQCLFHLLLPVGPPGLTSPSALPSPGAPCSAVP